jgi:hypothetical protein
MHAVVGVHDNETGLKHLHGNVVPQVKQAPGFVASYWVGLGDGEDVP